MNAIVLYWSCSRKVIHHLNKILSCNRRKPIFAIMDKSKESITVIYKIALYYWNDKYVTVLNGINPKINRGHLLVMTNVHTKFELFTSY